MTQPPRPKGRPGKVSLWHYIKMFRADILSAQPDKLFRAWMAEFRTPFFRSYLVNQPDLVSQVLKTRPKEFPKSNRVSEGLRPLLGNSVFLTNGDTWERQRRIIDPAFEGGRLREIFPSMSAAIEASVIRLKADQDWQDIEQEASYVAADIIFRTLFSIPIEDAQARAVFEAFRDYQRSSPVVNIAALVPLPNWLPRFFSSKTKQSAKTIRALIAAMVDARAKQIAGGCAPDDLATKIMTTADPHTGELFSSEEMVDQVAIFFLAGHETSASALGWALYLLATHPEWQEKVATEAANVPGRFEDIAKLTQARAVFRETLRLYPPVPMMVRETTCPQGFRDRQIKTGSQIVISPWHVQRHERIWDCPHDFDPARWSQQAGRQAAREAFIPFSAGPRICTGAGFAMAEGVLLISRIVGSFKIEADPDAVPIPQAHLTLRARDGITLRLRARED